MATQSVTVDPQALRAEHQVQNAPSAVIAKAQALVDKWNKACAKLADLYEEVDALKVAFGELKDGQEILGCKSFKVFCVRHLHRDHSTVYRMMKKARLSLEPAVEEEPLWEQAEPGEEGDEAAEEENDEEEGEEGTSKKSKKKRTRIDMKAATNAHYAERYLNLVGLLTNAPKDASPQEIIATMQADAQSAYEDLDEEMALKIKVPKLVKLKDADYTGLKIGNAALKAINDSLKERLRNLETVPENLRDETIAASLNAEPDTGRATKILTTYLQTVVDRVLPSQMKAAIISATVSIVARDQRIMPGDWLQEKHKLNEPSSLAKCTGTRDFMHRRVISEWNGTAWTKEHFILNNQEPIYTVITEETAMQLAPEAFA